MDATLKDSPLAILNRIFFTHDLDFQVCEPAKVVKVYNDNTALVQPLTKLVSVNKEKGTSTEKDVSPIRVSLLNENHGGFYVEHPILEGETGWVFASDRNTSLVRQYNSSDYPDENEGTQTPNNDKNLHKSHFGFFMPDRWITVPEQLVKELEFQKSRDGKVQCGGSYTIGCSRNKAGNFDTSAKFGIVRDDKGNDVPYTTDIEGHTRSLIGNYIGKYFWSMARLLSDGSVDLFGQGTRFSVREDGLYLNDRIVISSNSETLNSLKGSTEDSEKIHGDVSVKGADGSGLVTKTEIVEPAKDDCPQKSRLIIDIDGRGDSKFTAHDIEVYDKDGKAIGKLHFYSEGDFKIKTGRGLNVTKNEDGEFELENKGVLGIEQGSNVTIEPVQGQSGVFKISSSGGGSGKVIFEGSNGSRTDETNIFKFNSASDSNVEVKCSGDVITIGVYYI